MTLIHTLTGTLTLALTLTTHHSPSCDLRQGDVRTEPVP